MEITAVGVDISKGFSTVSIKRPDGKTVLPPFHVTHDVTGLSGLVQTLRDVGGKIRIVMEHTGSYWQPVAMTLKKAGFYVSVVNAMLLHKFSDNTLRGGKTDAVDARKLASYALAFWEDLREYSTEDETRQMLKLQSRLYERTQEAGIALCNALISLTDQTFPNVNRLFSSGHRSNGHVKWVDFVKRFWHRDCITIYSLGAFSDVYRKWCAKEGYRFSQADAEKVYGAAREAVAILPKNDSTKLLITQSVNGLNAIYDTLQVICGELERLASLLPEYETVMSMQGAGKITGPQLMAEIGDVRRFTHKSALVAFAGLDASPYQSGSFDSKSRRITKRGSPHLRKTLFQIACALLRRADPDNRVFQFMDRKRAEGKHFYVYMVAGAAKFFRIYYAQTKECLTKLDTDVPSAA